MYHKLYTKTIEKYVFCTFTHSDCLIREYIILLPVFEIREYVTPSLLKERVHLLPRKNNYLEPWLGEIGRAHV